MYNGDSTFAPSTSGSPVNQVVALPGDANFDGKVDIADLTILLANFGRSGATWSQGNFADDPTVDIEDLTILLTSFGRTVGAPASTPRNQPAASKPSSTLAPGTTQSQQGHD